MKKNSPIMPLGASGHFDDTWFYRSSFLSADTTQPYDYRLFYVGFQFTVNDRYTEGHTTLHVQRPYKFAKIYDAKPSKILGGR